MANPYPHHHHTMYASPTLYSSGLVIPTSNSRPGSPQMPQTHDRKRGAGEEGGYGRPEGKRSRIEDGGYARHPQGQGGSGASAETEDIMAGIRGAFTAHPGASSAPPPPPPPLVNSAHSYPTGASYPTFTAAAGFAAPSGFGRQATHSQTPVGDEEDEEGDSEDDEEDKGRGEGRGDGEGEGERKRPKMTRGSR